MVQSKNQMFLEMPAGWQRTYQSEQATLGTLDNGEYQALIARLTTSSIQPAANFTDGYISFYLTGIRRTEYIEGSLAGCVVEGYFNLRAVKGYAILHDEDLETWILMVTSVHSPDPSAAQMRKKAMTLAKALGWIKKEVFPVYG